MATIHKRKNSDGSIVYRVQIRKKTMDVYKTFCDLEDAQAFAYYKEKLIDNMSSFEIPVKERLKLETIVEMKIREMAEKCSKTILDFKVAIVEIRKHIDTSKYLNQLTFDDWLEAAKKMASSYVYRGTKDEKNRRIMSPLTLRRHFACLSSCFSYAQSRGIAIDNHPLKVMQTFINPKAKSLSSS